MSTTSLTVDHHDGAVEFFWLGSLYDKLGSSNPTAKALFGLRLEGETGTMPDAEVILILPTNFCVKLMSFIAWETCFRLCRCKIG
jgi:hypothetical protein